uniref:RAG1 importin-binding domain-containing protein n=1 Tax=Clytia hemisphaerica TaxID=252671 RepID=A0A7M5WSY0_9CNID
MEEHIMKISNLCRLCRKKITTNDSYSDVKTCIEFKDKILFLFSYDISQDNLCQHPNKLCHNCSVKMSKVNFNGQFLKTEIAEFEKHDESCTLCRIHRLKEHKFSMKKSKGFNLETIIDIARENGFILLDFTPEKEAKIALFNNESAVTFLISQLVTLGNLAFRKNNISHLQDVF